MKTLRAMGIIGLGMLLAGAATPPPAAPSPTRADVEAALNKDGRAGEAELPRLGASAETILITIAVDREAAAGLRGRAVAALAYARTARTHVFLENLVLRKAPSSEPTDRLLVRRAAVSLGWQSGPRVVEIIAPLLDHPDAEVRLDAAVGLGLSRAAKAEAPLRAHLEGESDPAVRRQIEAALRAFTGGK